MKLLYNILNVASSNIISFGSSFIVGFVLPLYLSVSEFGLYKEYMLYLSFVYLFNFGYNDGIFIKYGGQELNKINRKVVNNEHSFILLFQLFIFVLMAITALILNNIIFLLFSIATLFTTIITYQRNLLQAVGEFKLYAKSNIIQTFINIFTIIVVLIFDKTRSYIPFVVMNIITTILSFVYLEYHYYKIFGYYYSIKINDNFKLFRVGIFILIANMSMAFIGNVGSWFVNIFFSIEDFAQYSFSNSLLNTLLLIVNSVGMVFYSVIAKTNNMDNLNFVKRILLLIGIIGGELFFIFSLIVNIFMQEYIPSISILAITFLAVPYIIIARIIIANLYKSKRSEKKYFLDMILLVVASICIVAFFYFFTKTLQGIAMGTFVTYLIWYIYSTEKEFIFLKNSVKDIFLIISHIFIFYITASLFPLYLGVIIYFIYILLISYLFRDDFMYIIKYFKHAK